MRGVDPAREQINQLEAAEIKARRARYRITGASEGEDAVGLSISGGGIRSATFALGVVQQLAHEGILHQVDYLSTVSGGGYLGAFITSFLNDDSSRVSLLPEKDNLPFGAKKDPESRGVRQLRNHSKSLTEGGIRTLATIVALIVYGVFTSALLLSPFLLTDATDRWYEFDLTSFINQERTAGRAVTGVLLRNMLRGEVGDYYTAVNSREAASNQPQLVIEQ
jgi:hypothetical protein